MSTYNPKRATRSTISPLPVPSPLQPHQVEADKVPLHVPRPAADESAQPMKEQSFDE